MSEVKFAAQIGLDWADKKHDYFLSDSANQTTEHGEFKHHPASIDKWARDLQHRFNNEAVAICLELKSGPIVAGLKKYDFMTLFFVPPQALANYRKAFYSSGAKDDPTDAYLQFDYLNKHRSKLRKVTTEREDTRIIQQLTFHRRAFVEQRKELTNKISASLKEYYPLVLQLFTNLNTDVFCDFMTTWPDLSKLQNTRRTTLEKFFKTNHCNRPGLINERLQTIAEAVPLTNDTAIINPCQRYTLGLVRQLRTLRETIKEYDDEITARFSQHEDSDIFASFPGAGPTMAPRLLAAFGSDRERFDSADEVNRTTGVAPVFEGSGDYRWLHWRFKCSKFLRQTFVEWAGQSIKQSFWARTFYDEKRGQGKSHQGTLRALAFKWIRIMYRCWKEHSKYDESTYLFALKRREEKLKKVA